jgi:hypothetical protein
LLSSCRAVSRSLSSCRGHRTAWCRGCGRSCRVVCGIASRGVVVIVVAPHRVVTRSWLLSPGHVVLQSQSSWSRRRHTSPPLCYCHRGRWLGCGRPWRGRPHVHRQGRWKVEERCAVRWKREKKTTYINVVPESHCSSSVKATHEGRIG